MQILMSIKQNTNCLSTPMHYVLKFEFPGILKIALWFDQHREYYFNIVRLVRLTDRMISNLVKDKMLH